MSTQETAEVTVKMIFTTDHGEIPDDAQLEALIAAQMSGELDDDAVPEDAPLGSIGLGCMAVRVTDRTGDLEAEPHILVVGDPSRGFEFIGPVTPNDGRLEEYTDRHLRDTYWWYCPLTSLSKARSDTGYLTED